MRCDLDTPDDARTLRVAVARSRYHPAVTEALLAGAIKAWRDHGGHDEHLEQAECHGAWELTAVCTALATRPDPPDAIVSLGCVISGETDHDRWISGAVATALATITVRTGVPVTFGVLTCSTLAQATARAGGDRGNKGAEAMAAAIAVAHATQALRSESAVT